MRRTGFLIVLLRCILCLCFLCTTATVISVLLSFLPLNASSSSLPLFLTIFLSLCLSSFLLGFLSLIISPLFSQHRMPQWGYLIAMLAYYIAFYFHCHCFMDFSLFVMVFLSQYLYFLPLDMMFIFCCMSSQQRRYVFFTYIFLEFR
jgi:hypothetical protein